MNRLKHWCGVAACWIAMTGLLLAQEAPNEFVPAETLQRPELPAGPMVYAAYSFVWVAVLVYVFILWRKLGRVERELADVHSRLKGR